MFPAPSEMSTLKLNVPDTDGVPLSTPPLLRVSPAGIGLPLGASAHVTVPDVPLAVSVWLYDESVWPKGSVPPAEMGVTTKVTWRRPKLAGTPFCVACTTNV